MKLNPFIATSAIVAFTTIAAIIGISAQGGGWLKIVDTSDGTYQTFGALHRMLAGELPGIHQYPYLGHILTYSLFPLFWAMGGTAFAAFASAQAMTLVVFWALCVIISWIFGFRRPAAFAIGTTIFTAFVIADMAFPSGLTLFIRPGASIIGYREACAIIVAAFAIWAVGRCGSVDLTRKFTGRIPQWACLSAFGGVMLSWSNAAGLATAISLGLAILLNLVRIQGLQKGLVTSALAAFTMIASSLAFITLLSAGNPTQYIEQNYLLMGSAQFWFFGGFEDDHRILHLSDLRLALPQYSKGIVYLTIGVVILGWRIISLGLRDARAMAIIIVFPALFISSTLSQIGGHTSSHYSSLLITACFLALIVAWVRAVIGLPRSNTTLEKIRCYLIIVTGTSILSLSWSIPVFSHNRAVLIQNFMNTISEEPHIRVDELGLNMPAPLEAEISELRRLRKRLDDRGIPDTQRSFSTYFAWPDLLLGSREPSQRNSIIHVFGEEDRQRYLESFRSTQYARVFTLSPYQTGWYSWNVRASWYFFRHLVANYEPVYLGNAMMHWTPRKIAAPNLPTDGYRCDIHTWGPAVTMVHFHGGTDLGHKNVIADVRLTYSLDPGAAGRDDEGIFLGRGYLRVGDFSSGFMYRHLQGDLPQPDLSIDKTVAQHYGLPSGSHAVNLPIEHRAGTSSHLLFEAQGSAGASLSVSGCSVERVQKNPFAGIASLPGR